MKINSQKNQRGFTFMEVMVAMSVIVIGLTAALGLIAFTISSGTQDKNHLIAINLAQEGVEIARNFRDDNWVQKNNWDKGFLSANQRAKIDYNDYNGSSEFKDFRDNKCDEIFLKFIENEGYQYEDGDETIFSRCVTARKIGGLDDYIKIISEVTVNKDKKDEYKVQAVAFLYGWKP